uniref:50S ribosomal protein L23 n=1 Tax=Ningiella ruwaisensis TaxID=2364274 RepID=UPI00109F25EC|nr:50S ribosomal protein L23 [Ningiella ruwaisensis]
MNQERLLKVLVAPHVSEKATIAAETSNTFVFKVVKDANKAEIKAAVELLFEVEVDNVRTVNCTGKKKRYGQHFGKRSDWKKAYVSLKEGQDIDFVGAGE